MIDNLQKEQGHDQNENSSEAQAGPLVKKIFIPVQCVRSLEIDS